MNKYNGIRLKIKTDGNLFKFIVNMDSYNDLNHPAYVNFDNIRDFVSTSQKNGRR